MNEKVPEGRWVDTGSGPGYDQAEHDDQRPEFSPAVLVSVVQRLLWDRGIIVDPQPARLPTAVIAAADLLRAFGVRPVNTPQAKKDLP